MRLRSIAIGAAVIFLGAPVLFALLALGFFYSVFYFPNRSSATAETIVSSGTPRDYLLYVPPTYDPKKPTPLVLVLHTSMSWDSAAMAISRWNVLANENGFIVVYPQGTGLGPKSWEMEGSETPARMPDVLFISDLIDKLEGAYNIDRARIYANGMSNGAGMAFVLSCTLSNRIAAVGMISAGIDPDASWCTDHTPVPVVAFHGTGDPVCPYNGGPAKLGGGVFPNVPQFYAAWARRNRCESQTDSAVATGVTRRQFARCANDADVIFYTIEGAGHQWPGGRRISAEWMVGPYTQKMDATRQMWAFFRQHALGASP
jgi:polyhydroxybutyrate depolymerase